MVRSSDQGVSIEPSGLAKLLAPRGGWITDAPTAATVAPSAESFVAGEGRIGVLLCHGFTGSPASLRPWGEHLVAAGYRVRIPRLPGHGTDWREMNLTTWQDWYACVEQECRTLSDECDVVVLGALSMGGSLALRLAARFGDQIAGLALVNPSVTSADRRMAAVPVLKRLTESIAGIADDIAKPGVSEHGYRRTPLRALASMMDLWRVVGAELPLVDQPLLLFTSVIDHVVDPSSAELIIDRVTSDDLARRPLTRSFHVATLDWDAPAIFTESAAFFSRVAEARLESSSTAAGRG